MSNIQLLEGLILNYKSEHHLDDIIFNLVCQEVSKQIKEKQPLDEIISFVSNVQNKIYGNEHIDELILYQLYDYVNVDSILTHYEGTKEQFLCEYNNYITRKNKLIV